MLIYVDSYLYPVSYLCPVNTRFFFFFTFISLIYTRLIHPTYTRFSSYTIYITQFTYFPHLYRIRFAHLYPIYKFHLYTERDYRRAIVLSTADVQWLNTDSSFTSAISNSFLSPLENNPIATDLRKNYVDFFFILKMKTKNIKRISL